MRFRTVLTRGVLAAAVAAAAIGSVVATPAAAAAPLSALKGDNDNQASQGDEQDGGGLGSLPIIGDAVGASGNANPVEVVTGTVQFVGAAAGTVVPALVHQLGR